MMLQVLTFVGMLSLTSSLFYGSSSNTFNSVNTHNTQSTGYNTHNNQQTDNCPTQVDFSADLQLSADTTGYPVIPLNAELTARPDLTACLSRSLVLPNASVVPVDPALLNSVDTCPSEKVVLTSFVRYGARCWIVPSVQEIQNFTVCLSQKCIGCDDFYSGWGSEARCIRQYQYVSVWAFCEGLPELSQITRERIILPYSCTCSKVRCYSNSYFWKKR